MLQQFESFNEQLDEVLDEVEQEIDDLLDKLENIDKEMDKNQVVVKDISKGTKKLNNSLEKQNEQMDSILEKMREPNKFCMDICFLIICCFLLAMFVIILQKYLQLKSERENIQSSTLDINSETTGPTSPQERLLFLTSYII